MKKYRVSIVIPIFNEICNIKPLLSDIKQTLTGVGRTQIIFVDDGSTDGTLKLLQRIHQNDEDVGYISLSRNFGHQSAIKAGLDHAVGDAVVTMDGDLQHPPKSILEMIGFWEKGYDVVYAVRKANNNVPLLKQISSKLAYKIINFFSDIHINENAADFRLLDRKVVDSLKNIRESPLFIRGLIPWLGFKQHAVSYSPAKRLNGETKFTKTKMFGLALDGITASSVKPLHLTGKLGAFICLISFLYGLYVLTVFFFTDQAVSGWASIIISVWFLGGIQLITLGVIGQYLGRLFIQSKSRPEYIIEDASH